jgi:adenosine kinase
MSIAISGSLAYDYIMSFPDQFKNHILPDKIHILNVCFVIDRLTKEFGGTGGNIAHTMNMLGAEPIIVAPLGMDGRDYMEMLEIKGITTEHIPLSESLYTSSAYITTDKDDNQVTAFYPGAGIEARDIKIENIKNKPNLALLSPAEKNSTLTHAKECNALGIPFVFDPGQQITAFSDQEIMMMIGLSSFLIANDYELALITQKTGWDESELLNHVNIIVKTLGGEGSVIMTKDRKIKIGICPAESVTDPTGAGDAYRAGFFTGYERGFDLELCGQMGAVSATYAIEKLGTQNHMFTKEEFIARLQSTFGVEVSL